MTGAPLATYSIDMPFGKTDKATWDRQRDARPVLRRRGPLDAGKALRRYLRGRGMAPGGPDALLFPRLYRTTGAAAIVKGSSVAYSHDLALGNFRWQLSRAGVDPSAYGTHSLRSSGATHYLARGLAGTSSSALATGGRTRPSAATTGAQATWCG